MRRLGLWAGLAAVMAWSLAPFVWQLLTSLKPVAELEALPPLLPGSPTLVHYRAILAGEPFGRLMLNSLAAAPKHSPPGHPHQLQRVQKRSPSGE